MPVRRSIAALVVALVSSSAAAQPITPPPPVDPAGDLDEVAPRQDADAPDIDPGAAVGDALEGAGEIAPEPPDLAPDETAAEAPPDEEDALDDERLARRRKSRQAALEAAEPRPPLAEVEPDEPPPWVRRLEIGGHFAFVLRPLANGVVDSRIGYKPAPGWGIHIHWPIVSWLRFSPYFLDSHHALDIPPGALAVPGSAKSILPTATIETATVTTFSFGAKLQPTWNITDELRTWATLGFGWGRFEFPTMIITEGDQVFEARDRSGVFVEFPLGLGVAFDVIPRWLAIEYEVMAAPVTSQSGNAHDVFQAVDQNGEIRDVGPFGAIELSVVQTLGLSLIF